MNERLQKAITEFAAALHETIMSGEGAEYSSVDNDAYLATINTNLETAEKAKFHVSTTVGKQGKLVSIFIYDIGWYQNPISDLFTEAELDTLRERIKDNMAAIKADKIQRLEAEIEALRD